MTLMDSALILKLAMGLMAAANLLSLARKSGKRTDRLSAILLLAGSFLLLALSLQTLTGGEDLRELIRIKTLLPNMDLTFRLDGVSAFFTTILGILSSAVAVYSMGFTGMGGPEERRGGLTGLIALFVLSLTCVFTAGDLLAFFMSWELMAFTSYFLVVYHHASKDARDAGLVYIVMTSAGTVFLLIAILLLYASTGETSLAALVNQVPDGKRSLIFTLLFIGFGTKAGLVPLHIWLPMAHPAAPSQASALMSGIMIKTGVYGILRFVFVILGVQEVSWGITLLTAGILTTVIGAAYAYLDNNYKRLLAFSSIENIGIIFMGLGVAAIGQALGHEGLSGLGLTAALLHSFNHGMFKALMFLNAGNVYEATHTKDLEVLGGLMKRMPHTGILMVVGAVALSAAVPLNGFISEWLTYRAFLSLLLNGTAMVAFAAMVGVVALAFAGVMATAAVVKFLGIAFLGISRSEAAAQAHEVPRLMLIPGYLLAGACLVTGLFPYSVISLIGNGFAGVFGMANALKYGNSVGFMVRNLSLGTLGIYPINTFALLLLFGALALALPTILGRKQTHRVYSTWDCGFVRQNSRMQYSAAGFAKPLATVFRMLFKPARELTIEKGHTPYHPKRMQYRVETEAIFEKYLYIPFSSGILKFASEIQRRVETGSIHQYLSYIFMAILVLIVYNIIR